MTKVWQVVIIGCHPTSMLGTKLILEDEGEFTVSAMVSSLEEGSAIVSSIRPQLVLMDYSMPEGSVEDSIMVIKNSSPDSHCVIMTDEELFELFQPLISMGASGVLSKGATPGQLLQLINALRVGLLSLPLDWMRNGLWPAAVPRSTQLPQLTDTETFIMERIVQGVTYDKIASELEVSRRSIDNYLRKIYVKLGVSSRAQAIEKFALYARQGKQLYA